ncbi:MULTISPECIES: DUF6861 domain-containing protein [unclassified Massilia]|uniref:DUF6861 domain-containing protein n=1 Tax=unclassified Massilia TaxID=2609279 RepID=UPI000B088FCC|nr:MULTISPECIES: polymorphic toxin type 15 domain-containing protein [unclassified Massilia]
MQEVSRVWNDLKRKEDQLTWSGGHPGHGEQYDSMGRPAGTSAHLGGAWGYDQLGRVNRVRKALHNSGPLAQRMIVERLAGIDLSMIASILVSACQDLALIYGGSTVIGGFIGGVGGAFFGGIGAVPGAAAGAAAGSYVGGLILSVLGLKSLVEGIAEAIPAALRHYQKGIAEAWGPERQDDRLRLGLGMRGDTAVAAFDLANGHVIVMMAILSVMTAYMSRGKADRVVLLNEIERSPRLGPRVAAWVEQNEERLRRQPALQATHGGAGGPHGPAQEPPPSRPRDGRRESEGSRPLLMPTAKVPCFKTNGLPSTRFPEFDRQLAGQETGLNDMTVADYLDGRDAFETRTVVRNPNMARTARTTHKGKLERKFFNTLRNQGLSGLEATAKAAEMATDQMKVLAALHNPDMVAGGRDVIAGFGDRSINSRIGAQWKAWTKENGARTTRLAELDKAAERVPESLRTTMKMNAKLERCK